MIISITGTPGTGKSTLAEILSKELGAELVGITDFVKSRKLDNGFDKGMKSVIVEIESLGKEFRKFAKEKKPELIIAEGHLSHFLSPDICIVLRLRPDLLEKRLKKRGYAKAKIKENLQAEILDVVYVEAIEECKAVVQVDATCKTPKQLANRLLNSFRSKKYKSDKVDWSKKYQKYLK